MFLPLPPNLKDPLNSVGFDTKTDKSVCLFCTGEWRCSPLLLFMDLQSTEICDFCRFPRIANVPCLFILEWVIQINVATIQCAMNLNLVEYLFIDNPRKP